MIGEPGLGALWASTLPETLSLPRFGPETGRNGCVPVPALNPLLLEGAGGRGSNEEGGAVRAQGADESSDGAA